MPYIGKGANGFGIRERYRYSASGSQTAFTGSDLDSKTLQFDSGSLLDVYLNGVLLDTADYNTSTANTVTLTSGATASDEVMIVVYDVFSLSDAMPKTGGTFTGGITGTTGTFSGDVSLDGGDFVFNESSADKDFRVESNGNTHMLFVDGGNNGVGIGTSSVDTASTLTVSNTSDAHGITIVGALNKSRMHFQGANTGSASTDGLVIGLSSSDDTNDDSALIALKESGAMSFQTAGTTRLKIDGDGFLGVATNPTSGQNHTLFVASKATNKQALCGVGKDGGYATEVMNVFSERTANSAFSLYKAHSNDNADAEFNFRGDGNAFCDGSFSGGGADYAEYFEWKDGNSSNEDRIGCSVILDGNKIVKASDTDDTSKIIGVISGSPVVIGDNDIERWKYKYKKDDFGRDIWEEYTITEWTENDEKVWYETDKIPDDVTVPSDNTVVTLEADGVTKLKRRKLNPDWDKSNTYIPREDRKEWDTVGLMGKLRMLKGQPTGDRWIKMRDISDTVEEWLVR
jgi:hypothetical protein